MSQKTVLTACVKRMKAMGLSGKLRDDAAAHFLANPIPRKPLSPTDQRLANTPPSARYYAFPHEATVAAAQIGSLGQTLARTVGRVATIHSPAEARRIVARLELEIAALKAVL